MRQATCLVALTLGTLLGACAGPTMTVRSEHDQEAVREFSRYRTYAWVPHSAGPDARLAAAVGPLVVRAADEILAAKGYRGPAGTPDFVMAWHTTVEAKRQVSTLDVTPTPGIAGGARLRTGPSIRQTVTTAREFDEGTLILDIADGRTGRHVWRGWAQAEVKADAAPAEREARIKAAVQQILAEFPPKQ